MGDADSEQVRRRKGEKNLERGVKSARNRRGGSGSDRRDLVVARARPSFGRGFPEGTSPRCLGRAGVAWRSAAGPLVRDRFRVGRGVASVRSKGRAGGPPGGAGPARGRRRSRSGATGRTRGAFSRFRAARLGAEGGLSARFDPRFSNGIGETVPSDPSRNTDQGV